MVGQSGVMFNSLSAIQGVAVGFGILILLAAPLLAPFYLRRHHLRLTRTNLLKVTLGYACFSAIPPCFALAPSFGLVVGIAPDIGAILAFGASTFLMGLAWSDRHDEPPPQRQMPIVDESPDHEV